MSETYIFSTLARRPDLKEKTLSLIEESFQYNSDNKFSIDFAPLISEKNHNQCHIVFIKETQEVIAHIGFLKKELLIQQSSYSVGLIGGICVSQNFQGKGIFKELFQKVLNFYQDRVAIFMLWSNNIELYHKFDFFLCIEQNEIERSSISSSNQFEQTKYHLLSEPEKKQIHSLYRKHILSQCASFQRTIEDWSEIERITSTDLYIKKEHDQIVGYFFMNKGQDLQGIIHEIALEEGHDEIEGFGTLWLSAAHKTQKTALSQYASLVRIGNVDFFRKLVYDYSNSEILVTSIDNAEIIFVFQKQVYRFSIERFLTGLWGPHQFEEFQFQTKPLYIPGIDSI